MDIGGPAWSEAQRAWKRLIKRLGGDTGLTGERALHALSDVSLVRRLLDQAELASVRTARRDGRSWAEIATNLGITRQSAWERWREFDESTEPTGEGRQITVPGVVGLSVTEARDVLRAADLLAALHVPGSAPDPVLPPDGTVVDQVPEAGARRRPGSTITLWVQRGGGSAGVREPRRPSPSPRSASAEPSDRPTR